MFFSSVLICALVARAACDPSGGSSYDYDEATPEVNIIPFRFFYSFWFLILIFACGNVISAESINCWLCGRHSSQPRPQLKQSVTRWIERNPASIKKLVDGGIDAFLDEVGYEWVFFLFLRSLRRSFYFFLEFRFSFSFHFSLMFFISFDIPANRGVRVWF